MAIEHKPLFGDLIDTHEGLADELKSIDLTTQFPSAVELAVSRLNRAKEAHSASPCPTTARKLCLAISNLKRIDPIRYGADIPAPLVSSLWA